MNYALYAVDLLLYMSNAETVIPLILNLLQRFGVILGYKLNLHKSELLPLNLDTSTLENIRLPFKITIDSFTYHGVRVTNNFIDLFKQNFGKLIIQTKQDLANWFPLLILLIGKRNTITYSSQNTCTCSNTCLYLSPVQQVRFNYNHISGMANSCISV